MGLFDQDDKQAQLDLEKAERNLKWEKPIVVIICFIIPFSFEVFNVSKSTGYNNFSSIGGVFYTIGAGFGFAIGFLILPGIIALIAKLLKFRWHYAFAISFAIMQLLSLTIFR
jgi:uncharacterized membrane protein required for colicin V production